MVRCEKLTFFFQFDPKFGDTMFILDGASVRSKIAGNSLFDDQSTSDAMLHRRIDYSVMGIG